MIREPSAPLRRFESPTAFLADPIGGAITGHTFVLWARSAERIGAIHHGAGNSDDVPTIAMLFPIFAHPALAPRYDILHDLSEVGAIAPEHFQFFEDFLRVWIAVLSHRVRRVAVLPPTGLTGAAFMGLFHQWIAPRVEAQLFEERAAANAWLDISAADGEELDALRAALAGPETLRRVREAIGRQLGTATLASIAEQLGIGARTLQRQLASHGTSFRDEVVAARIATAKVRLLEGSDKVESIARTVGFASTASFSTSFHKIVGVPPRAFRTRNAT